jgi:HEXXH motif-containing protein
MTSAASCSDLTVPAQGSETVRRLLSRYLSVQYRELLRLRAPSSSPEARALALVQRHCRALAADRPGPLLSAVQRATVGGLIRFLAGGNAENTRAREWVRLLLTQLYAELAVAGAPPPPILIAPSPSRLLVAGRHTMLVLPPGTRTLRLHPDGVTYAGVGAPVTLSWEHVAAGSTPLSSPCAIPISGALCLALADDSPLAGQETHPDKQGNRLDLGEVAAERWAESMRTGLELVRTGLPDIAAEIELLIQQLVPVGYDEQRHLSASFQESIGTIYLSLHPEPMTLAEALIHEHAHNKINMLWTFAPVLENAFSPTYPSPFRPDPRPLHGVLLGVHAFLPVELLYERFAAIDHPATRDPNFERRRRRVRERNAAACETLARYARPTESGRGVMDEIARWNAHFA